MLRSSIVAMSVVAVLSSGLFADEAANMKNHVAGSLGMIDYLDVEARIAIDPWKIGADISMRMLEDSSIYRVGALKQYKISDWYFINNQSISAGGGVLINRTLITSPTSPTGSVVNTVKQSPTEQEEYKTKPYVSLEYENQLTIMKGYLADANNNGFSLEVVPYQNNFLKLTGGFATDKIQDNDKVSVFGKLYILF